MTTKNNTPTGTDPVNHPSHYNDGKIEVIDFIEDKNLGFHRGNAVKYIARAGKKDPAREAEDLEKAIWYLSREVARLKGENGAEMVKLPILQHEGGENWTIVFRYQTTGLVEKMTIYAKTKKEAEEKAAKITKGENT